MVRTSDSQSENVGSIPARNEICLLNLCNCEKKVRGKCSVDGTLRLGVGMVKSPKAILEPNIICRRLDLFRVAHPI